MVAPALTNVISAAVERGDRLRSSVQLASDQSGQSFLPTQQRYLRYEAYYANDAYASGPVMPYGSAYGARHHVDRANLPKNIRSVLALARPPVDWWASHLYPGAWTDDGLPDDGGNANRIPYAASTPEEIRLAVQQAFKWGGWGGGDLLTYAFHGALLGDAFAEVCVDWERGKVYPRLLHPGCVVNIEFNNSGDVSEYALEIPMIDAGNVAYRWGKLVTKETVTTYKNEQPFSYVEGQPATIPNQWGFVPAVWVQHRNIGGQHGASVLDGLHHVFDELNGMQSAVDDYVIKFIRQKLIVSSKDPLKFWKVLQQASATSADDDEFGGTSRWRRGERHDDEIDVMPAPEGTSVGRMLANLGLGESSVHFDRIMQILERNWPELTLNEKLLSMTQVTGPGARALIQDVQHKLNDAAANYDGGVVKLGQMCASIGGELARSGAWGKRSQLTNQQQKFLPFDLGSWDRGELDFSLDARELIPSTMAERANDALLVEKITSGWGLAHAGLSPEQIYGVDPVTGDANPAPMDGLLAQKSAGQTTAANSFSSLFNAGNVG